MKLPNWVLPGSAVLFFSTACAFLQSPAERTKELAASSRFRPVSLDDHRFLAFARLNGSADVPLNIYVESDGAPWSAPDQPPHDPTPLKPLVLRIAISDPSPAVAYLGRPCQYLSQEQLAGCDPDLWTNGRFREEAIEAMNLAVDRLRDAAGVRTVNLIGYSGGGTVAALLAARRGDVGCLVTVAAPLDTRAWTNAIGVSALDGSLNPTDQATGLRNLPQTHIRGGKDSLVPPRTIQRFLDQVPRARIIDRPDADHECCWDEEWPDLRRRTCLND